MAAKGTTSQPATRSAQGHNRPLDRDLRGYLETNADLLTVIEKPVSIDDIGALSAQSDNPILFENITEYPDFRMCDILVKHRWSQCRALGVAEEDYLSTLAHRLRKPPRGFVDVATGPVKEVIYTGDDVDWLKLPAPIHSAEEGQPYISAMNIVKDPETGFYKYRDMGLNEMPIALVFGVHPAYEIMANFSGMHMDVWGEMEMVGTIMDQDVEMVPCETIDLRVPAHAEIVVEGIVDVSQTFEVGGVNAPTGYFLPKEQKIPRIDLTAITMRAGKPIYRNHQTVPDTDHQPLPRLCHEAVLYNRISEIGLKVHDVRFPTWGAAVSCVIQVEYPRPGFVNDALMQTMGSPWLNTKMVVAVSPDTDVSSAEAVYRAIATRVDPARDIFVVPGTRGSLYEPSGELIPGHEPWRTVGKIGIDATAKPHRGETDYTEAFPLNWGKVKLADYLS
ncbi:MAG: UbiD family decarboxylase domain-containing protein [Alphaproteobacteria bacterium]